MPRSSRLRLSFRLAAIAGLIILGSLAGNAAPAHAQGVVYLRVNTTADNAADACTGGPCSLRGAFARANSDAGTTYNIYLPSGHYPVSSTLQLNQGAIANLTGASQRGVVIDGGSHDYGVFAFLGAAVTMRNLSIQHGVAQRGGGIEQINGTLSLTSVTLSDNYGAGDGGALYLQPAGQDSLTAVTATGNISTTGGAIEAQAGTITIRGGTISHNSACVPVTVNNTMICVPESPGVGGAIVSFSTLTITSATIANNDAGNFAGGIESVGGLAIDRSTISGNAAMIAGGVENDGTAGATISGSTISGNFAANFGGGIYSGSPLTTNNDRILNNRAGGTTAGFSSGAAVEGLGAGIFLANSDMTDRASYISGNKALDANNSYTGGGCTSYGGGLFLDSGATATLSQARLIGNEAACGAGSYQQTNAAVQLSFINSFVEQNQAGDDGGGMMLASGDCGGHDLSIYNTRVTNNTAGNSGGGVFSPQDGIQVSGYGGVTGNHPDNISNNGC